MSACQVDLRFVLISFFVDRLEASRKYLFGSLGVLGTNNNSLIEGVLIARGTDIKPVVDVAPDFESYNYEKIDLANVEQKSYFEAALAWDLEVDGKKWADGKNVSDRVPLISYALALTEAGAYIFSSSNLPLFRRSVPLLSITFFCNIHRYYCALSYVLRKCHHYKVLP